MTIIPCCPNRRFFIILMIPIPQIYIGQEGSPCTGWGSLAIIGDDTNRVNYLLVFKVNLFKSKTWGEDIWIKSKDKRFIITHTRLALAAWYLYHVLLLLLLWMLTTNKYIIQSGYWLLLHCFSMCEKPNNLLIDRTSCKLSSRKSILTFIVK